MLYGVDDPESFKELSHWIKGLDKKIFNDRD